MNYYCVPSKGNFIKKPNMRVLLLLLFCSVLCAHAQVSSRSDEMSDSSFIYDPGLKSRRNIRITEHGDLNEIYRRTYNDTTLYKPVKEGWYIELDHSR